AGRAGRAGLWRSVVLGGLEPREGALAGDRQRGPFVLLGRVAHRQRVQAELRPGRGELVGGGLVEGEPHEAVGLLAGRGRPLEPQRPWTALPCPVHGAIGDHRDTSRPRATIDARGRRRGGRPMGRPDPTAAPTAALGSGTNRPLPNRRPAIRPAGPPSRALASASGCVFTSRFGAALPPRSGTRTRRSMSGCGRGSTRTIWPRGSAGGGRRGRRCARGRRPA